MTLLPIPQLTVVKMDLAGQDRLVRRSGADSFQTKGVTYDWGFPGSDIPYFLSSVARVLWVLVIQYFGLWLTC